MATGIILFIVLALMALVKFTGVSGSLEAGSAPGRVNDWESLAKQAGSRYGLPWQILLAMIWQESAGDPKAMGSAGEVGLMQLKQIALDDLQATGYGSFPSWKSAPRSNIMAGAAYLDLQLTRSGNLADALGETKADALESYNEGYAEAKKDLGPDEYTNEVLQKAETLGYDGQ